MNRPSSPSTTSNTASSSIRPRNRRFNSSLRDDELLSSSVDNGLSSGNLISPAASSRSSRAPSPIPSKHPSRSASSNNTTRFPNASSSGRTVGGSSLEPGRGSAPFTSGLWNNSWTTLQGLASNVLGSDSIQGTKDKPNATMRAPRRKRSSEPQHKNTFSTNVQGEWGPTPDRRNGAEDIGRGSKEAREALVRARKREDLLSANGHVGSDLSGRFKRRLSDDRGGGSSSAPPIEHEREEEREALVYVHHVQPRDTLAGIIIQFNCQPAVFRKANRLWPNDTIQVRKTVLLPVEACGVKGKPIPDPSESADLLAPETDVQSSVPTQPNDIWGKVSVAQEEQTISSPTVSSHDQSTDEPPWQHAYWVQIDGHPSPTEIARLSRRTLGYFPPSRRKSLSFSDLDTPPSASLDLPRFSPQQHPAHQALASDARNTSRTRGKTGKPRSGSATYFAQQMHGPGGVGTLGAGTSSPGPKQDGLNKYLARHLPNVAPRESFESLLLSSSNGTSTTAASASGVGINSGSGTGLENVGSAIEGWVRKLAKGAAAIVENPGGGGGSIGVSAGGNSGVGGVSGTGRGRRDNAGDLIELTDGREIEGGGGGDREQYRDRPSSSSSVNVDRTGRENSTGRGTSSAGGIGGGFAAAESPATRRRELRRKGD
ncbi:MAG: hypothetical protein M1837_005254 [Sclerophora amabilis]|nr:MAG: hypothetical protein M1837_005254 [Sclerophora amabilis]